MDSVLKDLLPKLRCPADHSQLRVASEDELRRLNEAIASDAGVENVGGARLDEALDAALVREAGDLAYPIRREIPILIVEEGIALA